jgi:hypothetical protein
MSLGLRALVFKPLFIFIASYLSNESVSEILAKISQFLSNWFLFNGAYLMLISGIINQQILYMALLLVNLFLDIYYLTGHTI